MKIAHLLEKKNRSRGIGSGGVRGPNAFRSAAALHDPEILRRKGLMSAERGIWPLMTFDGKTVGDSAGWSIALSLSDAELAVRVLPALRGADSALTARAG